MPNHASSAPPTHPTAPPVHLNCTSSAAQLHIQHITALHLLCTPSVPPGHPNSTSNTPQTVHLLAPQSHLHPHRQHTSNYTSQRHNLYKSMFNHKNRSTPLSTSEVHPRLSAPPSTSAHQGCISSQDHQIWTRGVEHIINCFRVWPFWLLCFLSPPTESGGDIEMVSIRIDVRQMIWKRSSKKLLTKLSKEDTTNTFK